MCVISSQKWLKRAKIGVLHGTPKKFMRPNKGVSDTIVQDQMNNKIYLIRFGHTKALLKNMTRNGRNSRPAETDPNASFMAFPGNFGLFQSPPMALPDGSIGSNISAWMCPT